MFLITCCYYYSITPPCRWPSKLPGVCVCVFVFVHSDTEVGLCWSHKAGLSNSSCLEKVTPQTDGLPSLNLHLLSSHNDHSQSPSSAPCSLSHCVSALAPFKLSTPDLYKHGHSVSSPSLHSSSYSPRLFSSFNLWPSPLRCWQQRGDAAKAKAQKNNLM